MLSHAMPRHSSDANAACIRRHIVRHKPFGHVMFVGESQSVLGGPDGRDIGEDSDNKSFVYVDQWAAVGEVKSSAVSSGANRIKVLRKVEMRSENHVQVAYRADSIDLRTV